MRKILLVVASVLALSALGCEQNDLGRYCVVGQPVPTINPEETVGQPSVTVLNIEAPECNDRICLQQGPYKLRPGDDSCTDCQPPYRCENNQCIYDVKSFCTTECQKHKDCSASSQDANGDVCTQYVCNKQEEGQAFEGHCICVCKDFLIDPDADPPAFYKPEDEVPEPNGCK